MQTQTEPVPTREQPWLTRVGFWVGVILAAVSLPFIGDWQVHVFSLLGENIGMVTQVAFTLLGSGVLAGFLIIKGRGERQWFWVPLLAAAWALGNGLIAMGFLFH